MAVDDAPTGSQVVRTSFERASKELWYDHPAPVIAYTGENGVGKSRLLARIASDAIGGSARQVVMIANTVYDKFGDVRGRRTRKLLARNWGSTPDTVIKRAIRLASRRDELRLRRIPPVLQHCGYDTAIGVQIELARREASNRPDFDSLSSDSAKRAVPALVDLLNAGKLNGRVFVFDFGSPLMSHEKAIMPMVIRYERELKRLGVIDGISIFLHKQGEMVPLRAASSGELSLISTMIFLSIVVEEDAVVLIDEPENSLHPVWQREYLDLTLQYLGYLNAKIRIATHSPIIVASLANTRVDGKPLSVFLHGSESSVLDEGVRRESHLPLSLDGVLAEAFGALSPASHYLSISVVDLLEKLRSAELSLEQVLHRLKDLEMSAADDRQRESLGLAREMAQKLSLEER